MRASATVLLGLLALAAAPSAPAIAAPDAPGRCGPVVRPFDAVELTGMQLRRLRGTRLDRLGLVVARDGAIAAIPFQLDERRGRKVALDDGLTRDDDDQPGVVDADDLLVFLACDAGERLAPEALAAVTGDAGAPWREIQVHDPLDGTSAYAYLVVRDAPPASPRRYATYDPDRDLVATAAYRIGCVGALPSYFTVALGRPMSVNLIDGLRLRAEAVLAAELARWRMTERAGGHALVGWKAGPVRVVRRSEHTVKLALGIDISAGYATTYFYPRHVYGPGSLKLPLSPSLFFRDITAMAGVDMRDLRGWRYRTSGTPRAGLRIDGVMDPAEQALAGAAPWFVLEDGRQAIFVTLAMSENLARAIPFEPVYVDDAHAAAPPELTPGSMPLVGWRGRHIERLSPDRYTFQLHVVLLDDWAPGAERRVLDAIAHPLATAVNGPGLPAAAPRARR